MAEVIDIKREGTRVYMYSSFLSFKFFGLLLSLYPFPSLSLSFWLAFFIGLNIYLWDVQFIHRNKLDISHARINSQIFFSQC